MAVPKHIGAWESGKGGGDSLSPTVLHASSGPEVLLPSDSVATDSQFVKQGDDLLLITPDGGVILVKDYFLSEPPPILTTPNGGRLTPDLVASFTPPEASGQYAQASGLDAGEAIGQVTSLVGKAYAVRINGTRVLLSAGDSVYQGDVVETADGGAINMLFIDKTTFALGADARLALDEMVFDPNTHDGSSSFSILKGVFVFSSGQIAKFNYENMIVKTTIATIGIRGTKVAGEVKTPGEVSTFTVIEGEIVVRTDAGFVVMSEANETTFVTAFSAQPSESVVLDESQLDFVYRQVKGISNGYFQAKGIDKGNDASGEGVGESGGSEGGGDVGGDGEGGDNGSGEGGGEGNGEGSGEGEPSIEELAGLAPAAGDEGEGDGGSEGGGEGDSLVVGPVNLPPSGDSELFSANFDTGGGGSGEGGGGSQNPGGGDDPDGGTGEGDSQVVATNQTITGNDENNTLIGGPEDDNIDGGGGDDNIDGGAGNDTLNGGDGDDTLTGGDGDDVVNGGVGADVFIAASGAGNDSYDGGEGIDTIKFTSAIEPVTVNLQTGELQLGSSFGAEIDIDVIKNVENVVGGQAGDIITGNDDANVLNGGAGDGNDTISGLGGNDAIVGDAGNDTLDGGTGNDAIVGGAGNDTLDGGEGNDLLSGGDGNDSLEGGDGDDTLEGGPGSDLLEGGAGDDDYLYVVNTDSGPGSVPNDDEINDASGDQDLIFISGVDEGFTQLGGANRIDDDLVLDLDGGSITIRDHFNGRRVESVGFDFGGVTGRKLTLATTLVGNDDSELIVGTDNAETLDGGGGDDLLFGGGGDDVFVSGAGNDFYDGGDGFDELNFAAVSGDLTIDMAAGTVVETLAVFDVSLS